VHSYAAFRGARTARLCKSVGVSSKAQEEFEQAEGGGGGYQCQKENVNWPQHITAAGTAA
jgi:hypothetical protein